uniref:PARP catalytic domain-containing protein n=1 Tax=Paramormyrops kingsleyae TaxID=1676925 RepID=A0A3B3QD22_9TELE
MEVTDVVMTMGLDKRRRSRTYIMYHGTTGTAALSIKKHGFQRSTDGMLGPGVYVSRSFQKARVFPANLPVGEQRAVLNLRVRVGKVKKIDRQGHPLQKTWHQHGYDTAWVPPNCGMVPIGMEEDCVWDPRRIKVLDIIYV